MFLAGIAVAITGLFLLNKYGSKPVIVDDVTEVAFSRESGFYENDFELFIKCPDDAKIYYTVDSSEPTVESIEYTGPIHISDSSENENVYSVRTDVSTAFYYDLIEKYSGEPSCNYTVPDYPVDKCTVIRARAIWPDGRMSNIKSCSYFVGYEDKPGYENVNVLSITTDPENLFGYENGIYVTGRVFDENAAVFLNDDIDKSMNLWYMWMCNYSKDCVPEKEATCQFFSDGRYILSQNCGIKTHGFTTTYKNPKSLNMTARKDYSSMKRFGANLFGNKFFPKKMVLFAGGQDDDGKIMDYLVNVLCSDLEMGTQKVEPYVMFLDGEYWGLYWLTDKYDEAYLEYYYDVEEDDAVIIKNGELTCGKQEDFDEYNEFIGEASTRDMTTDEAYEWLSEQMDIDSFLDYFGTLLYVGRYADWPGNNIALWKSSDKDNVKYHDGKYRWMLFDVNTAAFDEESEGDDSFDRAVRIDSFFANLITNDRLRNELLDRMLELDRTVFEQSRVDKEIKKFRKIIDEPMHNHCKRFWGEDGYSKYEEKVLRVESFLKTRHSEIENYVLRHR